MAVNLVSPGVKVREIDLTIGRIDAANDQIAAFAGPFQKGPVDLPVLIQNESDLISFFGKPVKDNNQNAYWMTASNYLSYGGIMQVVRIDSTVEGAMGNAYTPSVGIGSTGNIKIKSVQDYINISGDPLDNSLSSFIFAAKNPGTWGNDLSIYIIDAAADQIISGISTNSTTITTVGFNTEISNRSGSLVGGATSITGITTTSIQIGKELVCDTPGVLSTGTTITSIQNNTIFFTPAASSSFGSITGTFDIGITSTTTITSGVNLEVGYGVSVSIVDREYAGTLSTSTFTGYIKGIITGIGNSTIDVKIVSRHSDEEGDQYIDYLPGNSITSIESGDLIKIFNNSNVEIANYNSYQVEDWYDQQKVTLGSNTVFWKNLAERPSTSEYVKNNGGKNDEINILVVDNKGTISNNIGEVLEKFQKLSKAIDGKITPSQPTYYKDYIRDNSNYLFAGAALSGENSRFSGINNYVNYASGSWGSNSSNTYYDVIGNKSYTLKYGSDYGVGGSASFGVTLNDITNAYSVFENSSEYKINYIISGPSSGNSIFEAQAKANYIISLAEGRKDCIAVISAYEGGVLMNSGNNSVQSNSTTQTNNIIKFFNGLTGSTYAVFDSGYKYTYDRFNNQFMYLACNSDVAGLMARTSINQFPWYSPAGASRGVLNNAIKLAYNPSEAQRDILYTNRINPIIASPGQGIILYGDKTASSYVSGFDRINVRKLFLTIENTIERAARSQLFEFNDAITRSNFVNLIDPYLRDVKTKRGITDYLLICDDSNNTPDIIDSNQFRADIFVKPARSINFINLTFVATRTGISFSEVVGNI